MSEKFENDVPLGFVGRMVGLKVIRPEIQQDEAIVWSARANHLQHRLRAVGGRIYLTNGRLVFGRHRLEAALEGREWSAALGNLISAGVQGRAKIVHVTSDDGEVERFFIRQSQKSAALIDAAIQNARPQSGVAG